MGNTSERPADDVERIVNEYGDMLYRLCVLMLKNESDAEDVVQEAIIKYYRKAPVFADQEHEKARRRIGCGGDLSVPVCCGTGCNGKGAGFLP